MRACVRACHPRISHTARSLTCTDSRELHNLTFVPLLFPPVSKPQTSLADPWPAPTVIPKHTIKDDCADYESELAVIIGKTCKNVPKEKALDYVLGYTACNDISSRVSQLNQSQWSFSKGFDGACPIGPTLVSPKSIPDPSKLKMRGLLNGKVVQESGLE